MITSRTTAADILAARIDQQKLQTLLDEYRGLLLSAARRAAGATWRRTQDEAIAGAMEGFWMAVQQYANGEDFKRLAFVECYRSARRQVRTAIGSDRLIASDMGNLLDDRVDDLATLEDTELVELLASGESITAAARILGVSRRAISRRVDRLRTDLMD
jgi:hypothetical protein